MNKVFIILVRILGLLVGLFYLGTETITFISKDIEMMINSDETIRFGMIKTIILIYVGMSFILNFLYLFNYNFLNKLKLFILIAFVIETIRQIWLAVTSLYNFFVVKNKGIEVIYVIIIMLFIVLSNLYLIWVSYKRVRKTMGRSCL